MSDLRKVRNRETLRRLDNGMEIVRATKHEPIDFESLSRQELTRLTDSQNGSKFLGEWSLERLTDWLEARVREQGWRFPPGVQGRVRVRMGQQVGFVRGRLVHTVTILASGRWVHAYPDEDQQT